MNTALDFEKIYRCIVSSNQPEQLTCCVRMINFFLLRHKKDAILVYMLHGMVAMQARALMERDRMYAPPVKPYVARRVKYIIHSLNYN